MRDVDELRRQVLAEVARASEAAANASDLEAALSALTLGAFTALGDRSAPERPGALKSGETQFFVAGVFVVRAQGDGHVLVAEHGFPPEQHRLFIGPDIGHPGWVYRHQRPLLLGNTDEHQDFKQILKTSRMGSAMYAPIFLGSKMYGQMIMAAQARTTFEPVDLDALKIFAATAAVCCHTHSELNL